MCQTGTTSYVSNDYFVLLLGQLFSSLSANMHNTMLALNLDDVYDGKKVPFPDDNFV